MTYTVLITERRCKRIEVDAADASTAVDIAREKLYGGEVTLADESDGIELLLVDTTYEAAA